MGLDLDPTKLAWVPSMQMQCGGKGHCSLIHMEIYATGRGERQARRYVISGAGTRWEWTVQNFAGQGPDAPQAQEIFAALDTSGAIAAVLGNHPGPMSILFEPVLNPSTSLTVRIAEGGRVRPWTAVDAQTFLNQNLAAVLASGPEAGTSPQPLYYVFPGLRLEGPHG